MTWIRLSVCCVFLLVGTVWGQPRVVGGEGKTVRDLAGTETYVTLVLELDGRLVRDVNLRIIDVSNEFVSVLLQNGERTSYLLKDVREVRVQDAPIARSRPSPSPGGALGAEDYDVLGRALQRVFEIFTHTNDNQLVKMRAAAVIASAPGDYQNDALNYLRGLSQVNDIATAVEASLFLYQIGDGPRVEIAAAGMGSGVRKTRASAVKLAGLLGDASLTVQVRELLTDPTIEVSPEAIKAAARLGDRAALERIVRSIQALNDVKNEAAVYALIRLGGPDVVDALRPMLETSRGMEWFRVLRVLYALNDPVGRRIMRERAFTDVAFRTEAAILLSRDGDWDATIHLRDELDRAREPSRENLFLKARIAATLFLGGHAPAKTTLQELLQTSPDQVFSRTRTDKAYKDDTVAELQTLVCNLIAQMARRNLMSLLPPVIQSANPEVALAACEAAVAIADPAYAKRLEEFRA